MAATRVDITSIDFSDVCIEIAKQRAPSLQWKTMDACTIGKEFAPGTFDVVLDKGLLDSMHLVGDPGSEAIEKISKGNLTSPQFLGFQYKCDKHVECTPALLDVY